MSQRRRSPCLRPNGYGRADASGVVKLPGFPVGHANAAVRRGDAGQIALVQSVTGGEFEIEWHRRADKTRPARFAILAAVDVCLYHIARGVDVIAVKTGTVVFIFSDNFETACRRPVSFPAARNS